MSDEPAPYIRLRRHGGSSLQLDVFDRRHPEPRSIRVDVSSLTNAVIYMLGTQPKDHAFLTLPGQSDEATDA